ncbi:hypothetical protein TIFTF001_037703 [Ficus carica]|uniref:Uncharacterized protein n=1 Tax=Ficus carica TaxID=3494 RepID=A0AA88JC39_FICCA|nr:hypothetical protein TIFTF001_037703 [Ficus carica]
MVFKIIICAVLMPEMVSAATPTMNGYSGRYWPVAPPSITCKREAPRNDGDTGVVSAVGTPMLKSARILICKGRGRPTGTGTRLVSAVKEVESWSGRPMPVQNLLLRSKCSEHYFVRAYGLFWRERGTWSAKDPVLGERPALNTAERCRRWYFVVGAYFDINISPSASPGWRGRGC